MIKVVILALIVIFSAAGYVFVQNKAVNKTPGKFAEIISSPSAVPTTSAPKIETPTLEMVTPQLPQFKIKIDSLSPTVANFGDSLTIKGSGFKTGAGMINIYGPTGDKVSGPIINFWSETEIRTTVPPLRGNTAFQIEIENPKGEKSNRVIFQTKNGQPIISNYPKNASRGNNIVIQGREFGDTFGEIKLYKSNSLNGPAENCIIASWMNNTVNCAIPNSLSSEEYGLSLKTSEGLQASFVYITIN